NDLCRVFARRTLGTAANRPPGVKNSLTGGLALPAPDSVVSSHRNGRAIGPHCQTIVTSCRVGILPADGLALSVSGTAIPCRCVQARGNSPDRLAPAGRRLSRPERGPVPAGRRRERIGRKTLDYPGEAGST